MVQKTNDSKKQVSKTASETSEKFEEVELIFDCNANKGGNIHTTTHRVKLPRAHARQLFAALTEGGTPEGHFSADPAVNTWLTPEQGELLRQQAQALYADQMPFDMGIGED